MEADRLRETIASAQAGSAEAYKALLDVYGPRLYGYFFRATGRHHDAEDLLGELTLRLVRQLGKYDHRGRFEPWLFRIAANMVRDRIRRRKSRPTPISMSIEDDTGEPLADKLPGTEAPVDEDLVAAEMSKELHDALQSLDERTREIILLRFFGQMSFKELADTFQCPLGTVLARVHRGLKALRQIMAKSDERP
jgi:RNA polymerase sigma-70 factor (ECF subfamily)